MNKKIVAVAIIFGLVAIVLGEIVFNAQSGSGAPPLNGLMGVEDEFVTVSDGKFMLGGRPHYFVGVNFWQGMNLAVNDSSGNRTRLGEELDQLQQLGVTNLRVMAASEGPDTEPYRMVPALMISPGVYNASVLDGLDYLLAQIRTRGMRAVMVLNNYWHWSGGMAQYVSWYENSSIPYPGDWGVFMAYSAKFYGYAQCQTWYRNHIQTIINRTNPYTGQKYRDDPTVFSWELANEPRSYPDAWIDDTAAYIKSLDSNHLVTTGSEGNLPWHIEDFIETHNGPDIDYTTIHIWPQNWGWYNPANPSTYATAEANARDYFQEHATEASSLGKPLVLEEFGLARDWEPLHDIHDPDSPTTYRDLFYTAMFEEVSNSASTGGPGAGDNIWAWSGQARPGDDWVGDPPHETPGWYSVYDQDESTLAIISAHADEMSPTQENDGDIEFVSVAYDPEVTEYPDKSESPYGPDVSPVYNMVKRALTNLNPQDPTNPLSNIVTPGDKVVLKPNLVGKSSINMEGCTRTPILRPIVDLAVAAGASEVIIAEGSASPDPTDSIFGPAYMNITGIVKDLQNMYPSVTIGYKNLNQDNFTWFDLQQNSSLYGVYTPEQLYSKDNIRMDQDSYYYAEDCRGYDPKGYRPGLYAIANTVLEADVFINVPKMKVHHITGVTLSLKNLIGITPSSTGNTTNEEPIKDTPHWNNSDTAHHGEELEIKDCFENDVLWRVMADLNKITQYGNENGTLSSTKQRRYLSVVDAIIGMEGPYIYGWPSSGQPRPTGVIVAGQDPVAVDAVCSRVMGFNYTVLRFITDIAKISDHIVGIADPTSICVVGCSLNNETFGDTYVPHRNYENPQIAPYKIRLQYFDPPTAIFIKTRPGTPREDVETEVIAYTLDVESVATGWLNFSLNGNETQIVKMLNDENAVIGEIGKLNASTNMSYSVCMQDFFFNIAWHPELEASVVPSAHPYIEILTPQFGFYSNNLTLTLNVTKGQNNIDTVWYTLNESAPTALEAPYTTQLTLDNGTHLITAYANDTFSHETIDETMVLIGPIHDVAVLNLTRCPSLGYAADWAYPNWHGVPPGETRKPYKINVTVSNLGDSAETDLEVGVYYKNATYTGIIEAAVVSSLDADTNTTLTFTWTLAASVGELVGKYTIFANVTAVEGDINITNNEFTTGQVFLKWMGDTDGAIRVQPDTYRIDIADVGPLVVAWKKTPGQAGWDPRCDFNMDGEIDTWDVSFLVVYWYTAYTA